MVIPIHFGIFLLPMSCLKLQRLEYIKLYFHLLLCMGAYLGLSCYVKNID